MVWKPRVRHRAALARRDAAFLWGIVRGRRPSPVIDRPASARSESASVVPLRGGVRPRPVRVVRTRRETADAVSIFLEEVDGSPIAFEAGQFLTLELTIAGERVRRAYSFASPALDGAPRHITVKRIAGGRASTYLQSFDEEDVPQTLDVLGPSGHFVAPPEAATLVCIAGGSGITPVASILETALATRPEAEVHLLFGNRSATDTIFLARFEALVSQYGERLRVTHEWEQPLTAERQRAFLANLPDDDRTHYFVCGPAGMMDASREALQGRPDARVHEERFSSPDAPAAGSGPQLVTIRIGETRRQVRSESTLLEAGLAAGLDMPFSCAMGGCAACKVRLVEGDVAMDETGCLTAEERAEGYVLACCSRATTPCTIEVER